VLRLTKKVKAITNVKKKVEKREERQSQHGSLACQKRSQKSTKAREKLARGGIGSRRRKSRGQEERKGKTIDLLARKKMLRKSRGEKKDSRKKTERLSGGLVKCRQRV